MGVPNCGAYAVPLDLFGHLSIYMSTGSKPVGVDCVAIDFSRLILLRWCYLHPATNPLFVSWLGTGVGAATYSRQLMDSIEYILP